MNTPQVDQVPGSTELMQLLRSANEFFSVVMRVYERERPEDAQALARLWHQGAAPYVTVRFAAVPEVEVGVNHSSEPHPVYTWRPEPMQPSNLN